MKKLFTIAALALSAVAAQAQVNVQLHYDMGRHFNSDSEANRQLVTTTVEMFKADALGSTYFFIDMDYYGKKKGATGEYDKTNHGNIGAYWEIGRDFTFAVVDKTNHSFTAHAEYDGGIGMTGPFQQAVLAGPAWQWHSNDFSKTFTLQALYKHFLPGNGQDAYASFQVTPVWGITFAKGLCSFSGFADLWWATTPKNTYAGNPTKKGLVFLSEPQFWFNVFGKNRQNNKLSVGTEVELSNNFIWYTGAKNNTFYVNPTLAMKYAF